MILINGPLVVVDKKNKLKAVVLFNGLTREKSLLFNDKLNPNTKNDMNMV